MKLRLWKLDTSELNQARYIEGGGVPFFLEANILYRFKGEITEWFLLATPELDS